MGEYDSATMVTELQKRLKNFNARSREHQKILSLLKDARLINKISNKKDN